MTLLNFKLLSAVLIISSFSVVNSQSTSSLFSYEEYVNTQGDTLKYRQLVCDYTANTKKYPLVIFLHGMGERGSNNESQLKWGVRNFATSENMSQNPCIVIAPQCPDNSVWGNYNRNMELQAEPTKPMKLLRELINEVIKKSPVDPNRIYITGLSMGGFGTYDAISRYPDLFAAAVPVCGGGDISKAKDFAHIPIWIFHGAIDSIVKPILSVNMLNALTEAGATPGYTQYPEVGHFSWIMAYSDKNMMTWLFKQRKESKITN
jgi:predicted peptidase